MTKPRGTANRQAEKRPYSKGGWFGDDVTSGFRQNTHVVDALIEVELIVDLSKPNLVARTSGKARGE